MVKIADYSQRDLLSLQDNVRSALSNCLTLEAAAQQLAHLVYDTFQDSVVLTRVFATLPYHELPPENQVFVQQLAKRKGVANGIGPDTLVLSLLGTHGVEAAWNERRQSVGHIGIPLISSQFIEAIPMVMRLLKELQVELEWFDRQAMPLDMSFVERSSQPGWVGVFYVPDAAQTVDRQGRHVIPDQKFVADYNIKTVFGVGGVYATGTIMTLVVFTRDQIDKIRAEDYASLIPTIKATTSHLVAGGQFFQVSPLAARTPGI